MKRILIPLAISLLSLALFTSCTSSADTLPQTSPSAAPTAAPTVTARPAATAAPTAAAENGMDGAAESMQNGGVNTVEDARRVSGLIDDEIEKLSEIDEAASVVAGNIALVAIEYDDQYQGGLTDRLKDMITERVESIDKSVTTVHVTDSKETASLVKELAKKLESAGLTFDELQTQLLNLGSSIAGSGTPKVSQPQSSTGA